MLADFGLAKADFLNEKLTQSGDVLGTPNYMPPEQARGEKVSSAADVYALGVLLFEMLMGGVSALTWDHTESGTERQFPTGVSLRQYRPDVSANLEQICQQCLAIEPRDRPLPDELSRKLQSICQS
jgi:serine/threonine protein kinase